MHGLSQLLQQNLKGCQHGVASRGQHVLQLPLGVEDHLGVGQHHVGAQEDSGRVALQVPSCLGRFREQPLHEGADVADVASGYDLGLQTHQQCL